MKWFNRIINLNEQVLGINRRNLEYIYPGSPRRFYPLADDKAKTKKLLEEAGIPIPPTYAIIGDMGTLQDAWIEAARHDALAIKPSRGRGGGGIMILQKTEQQNWQKPSGKSVKEAAIQRHIADIIFGVYSFGTSDRTIIEHRVNNHPVMASLYPSGVPDVRLITYRNRPVMGMLRVPTDLSDGRANLHQGAVGIALDIHSGMIGEGILKGHIFRNHPDTGEMFFGNTVPHWDEIIRIALHTSRTFPFEYIGIDIVLDNDLGPLIMEINLRPGLEIQNVNRKSLLLALKEEIR
jgi:alpha-L-glutamate ligase-like protein